MPTTLIEPDSGPGLTTPQKNSELSAKLATAPWLGRDITAIKRDNPSNAWWITYNPTAANP